MNFKSNSLQNPERVIYPLAAVVAVNSLLWAFRVFDHHFDFQWPDALALSFALIAPFGLLRAFKGILRGNSLLLSLVSLVLVFSLLPVTRFLIIRTDYSWLWPYTFLIASSIVLFTQVTSKNSGLLLSIVGLCVWLIPYSFNPDQTQYFDKLVESYETRRSTIHKIHWKGNEWLYLDGKPQFTTLDKHLYYEALVHPVMHLVEGNNLLLIGGDNHETLKELEKYQKAVDILPLDVEYFRVSSKQEGGVQILNSEILQFLNANKKKYDAIVVDLPDPSTIELNQYYTLEFYQACRNSLKTQGYIVTQSLSPYLESGADKIVQLSMEKSGFKTVPYHNQVPTLGQWSWTIGSLSRSADSLKQALQRVNPNVETLWWDQEAMNMMLSFGKDSFFSSSQIQINTIEEPVLFQSLAAKK